MLEEHHSTGLSVVVPAFNEGNRLGETIDRIVRYLGDAGWTFELIVVDDGSSDDTFEVARRFADGIPSVRVIRNDSNRGKGYSVRRGMREANMPLRLFCDADLAAPIEEIEKLLPWFSRGYDAVIGSRACPESVIEVRQSRVREFMGRSFGRIVRMAFGLDIMDTQCGLKMFTGDAAKAVFGFQRLDRYAFDVELLVLARRLGLRVKETGIRWRNVSGSHVNLLSTPLQMIAELLVLRKFLGGNKP
ncbi:MAG TPA: dolichyl-phosphate beta-glucosyltransferase [Candidatus Deferrimicrobiaceae bacterium]